jgi:hypothetical protein
LIDFNCFYFRADREDIFIVYRFYSYSVSMYRANKIYTNFQLYKTNVIKCNNFDECVTQADYILLIDICVVVDF